MRTPFTIAAYASWCALLIVWLPGYFLRKRSSRIPNLARQIPTTALLVLAFVCLFNPGILAPDIRLTPQNAVLGWAGIAIAFAGIAFAIWARVVLGGNWSGIVMEIKEHHELIQSGPYAIVRHPIYTGLLLAILGTALTLGTLAAYLAVALALAAFLIRVRVEEGLMQEQFGESHDVYRGRTKKLIPFVW